MSAIYLHILRGTNHGTDIIQVLEFVINNICAIMYGLIQHKVDIPIGSKCSLIHTRHISNRGFSRKAKRR